ncbi:MAG: amidohydrolase [Bryobacteraceae bacterium]|nr:amidohydrolase [Bryobacteraceae bacterium]
MKRRAFLQTTAAAPLLAADPPIPIIDTHVHLFDPSRAGGVPWPPKDNPVLYKTALPKRLREVTKGFNVVGAIEIEASPWFTDNQWVLDVCAQDTIMVGFAGNLEPGKPEFPKQLEQLARNSLFRGIRYGYLWDRDLRAGLAKPEFVADLGRLAKAGLSLDTANQSIRLLEDTLRITDRHPTLRIVIDHLPNIRVAAGERATYEKLLRELGARKQVYVKLSAILLRQKAADKPSTASLLDPLCATFGEDRVLYGSDWPNSDTSGTYAQGLSTVQSYFASKSRAVQEKFFWRNSQAAYRWVKRAQNQP